MSNLQTDRSTVRRVPSRGKYEKSELIEILNAAFVCHVGFSHNDQPFVIPTAFGIDDFYLYLHGATSSRMIRELEKGSPVCITVTLVDGLVLARSVFHHSMNYRSVVILGKAEHVPEGQKNECLKLITDHILEGRWDESRIPNEKELRATSVLRIPIEEGSAKVRTGAPKDDEEDYKLDIWAGELPILTSYGKPVEDPDRLKDEKLPNSLKNIS